MLVNLLPDFFALLNSVDPTAAYLRYFENHRHILEAYWENYVVSTDSPHFMDVINATVNADRSDLKAMLERSDVLALARLAELETLQLLETDVDVDVVIMVGVGAANAGELVVRGRGVAFICLEHFTGIQNQQTQGLGLDPELIPLWVAHEVAHAVRYTSPTSRSEMVRSIAECDGHYSYWESGRNVRLKELLINEGLATHASRHVSVGHAAWQYYGYGRRQYTRIREMENILVSSALSDLDRTGLGLRLRYLSGGLTDEARTVDKHVLPERAGYFIGAKLVEQAIRTHGFGWAIRANADEILEVEERAIAIA